MERQRFRWLSAYMLAIFLCALAALPAQATLVKTTFGGTVTEDNGGANPFGLSNGDAISGWAVYDDTVPTGIGDEDFAVSTNPGWDFEMTLGSFTFSQADVNDPTYTTFWFFDGKFDGVEFFKEAFDIGAFTDLLLEDFNGGRSLYVEDFSTGVPIYLEADWNFPDATSPVPVGSAPVPEPGTLVLLGAGLLGVAGFSRRKSQG